MGEKGEQKWRNICLNMCKWEWGSYDPKMVEKRNGLYPWTVADAKKYFLRGDGNLH